MAKGLSKNFFEFPQFLMSDGDESLKSREEIEWQKVLP